MLIDDSNLFQRLSWGDTLKRTVLVYKEYFCFFFGTAGLVVLADFLLFVLVYLLEYIIVESVTQIKNYEYYEREERALSVAVFVWLILTIVVAAVGNGTMIRGVAEIYLGRQPTIKECLGVGLRRARIMLGAWIVGYFVFLVGGAILIVPAAFLVDGGYAWLGFIFILIAVAAAIYILVRWSSVNPAIIGEQAGVFGSFQRSMTLVSGGASWLYVFCILLATYIPLFILQSVVSIFLGAVVAALIGILWAPMFPIVLSVLYIHLRVEKEGLDRETFARDLGEELGGPDLDHGATTDVTPGREHSDTAEGLEKTSEGPSELV